MSERFLTREECGLLLNVLNDITRTVADPEDVPERVAAEVIRLKREATILILRSLGDWTPPSERA